MNDIMGTELKIGQYIFYFRSVQGVVTPEEANVIKINPKTVKIEYCGNHKYGKKKGQQGNIYNTSGRIFVLDKNQEKERRLMVKAIQNLTEENEKLKKEVEKIYNRFEILDL